MSYERGEAAVTMVAEDVPARAQEVRVLWWDDWSDRLDIAAARLTAAGFTVDLLDDIHLVLDRMVKDKYDLVIMDLLGEPRSVEGCFFVDEGLLAGLDLLKNAYGDPACSNRDTPVVLYTRYVISSALRNEIVGAVHSPYFVDKFDSLHVLVNTALDAIGPERAANMPGNGPAHREAPDLAVARFVCMPLDSIRIAIPQWRRDFVLDWPREDLLMEVGEKLRSALSALRLGERTEALVRLNMAAGTESELNLRFDAPEDVESVDMGRLTVGDIWSSQPVKSS